MSAAVAASAPAERTFSASAPTVLATLIRSIRAGWFSRASQTILFLPQIVPLAAAGIAVPGY